MLSQVAASLPEFVVGILLLPGAGAAGGLVMLLAYAGYIGLLFGPV